MSSTRRETEEERTEEEEEEIKRMSTTTVGHWNNWILFGLPFFLHFIMDGGDRKMICFEFIGPHNVCRWPDHNMGLSFRANSCPADWSYSLFSPFWWWATLAILFSLNSWLKIKRSLRWLKIRKDSPMNSLVQGKKGEESVSVSGPLLKDKAILSPSASTKQTTGLVFHKLVQPMKNERENKKERKIITI